MPPTERLTAAEIDNITLTLKQAKTIGRKNLNNGDRAVLAVAYIEEMPRAVATIRALEAERARAAGRCMDEHISKRLWIQAEDRANRTQEALTEIDGVIDVLKENIEGGYPALATHQANVIREYARAALRAGAGEAT